jgi:multidrug efflux pump subunit AcrA (membrane-fusion protein)
MKKISKIIVAHKIWTVIIAVIVIGGGYELYNITHSTTSTPQYTISRVRMGNITQTVTGTGQVSAANQLDLTSQVSGTIRSINVKVGQQVSTGDLIATIDPTNALNSLNSAKLSLAKLTEAPKTTDLSNTQNSVDQSYSTAFNAISNTFTSLQTIIPGINTLFYQQGGFLSEQQSISLTAPAQANRSQAGMSFDAANAQYTSMLAEYKSLSRQSSTSSIAQVLDDTYSLAKNVANALQSTQSTITYITTNQPGYLSKDAPTTQSNVIAWLNSMNTNVSSLLSAQTGITSAENSLTTLVTGTDPLDIQSAQLTLNQAEQTYANYFIRAPFDGVIGRLPVNVYGQAGASTIMATIIGNQKIATLSLNEVDAASVKVGNPVSLTFDAINNFTATGTVSEVDLVGTVSSGVVTYTVKVAISNSIDSSPSAVQINPGMSVNAIITTNEVDNVLIVPAASVKTQGKQNYVQIIDPSIVTAYIASLATANGATVGTSTRQFVGGQFASSTFARQGRTTNLTISSDIAPTSQTVTIGSTDSTNTEIQSGLTAGEWVVTKTTTSATTAKTTAAPSLLSSMGAGGRGGGVRPGN